MQRARPWRVFAADDVQRAVFHYVVLHQLDGAVLSAVFFLPVGQSQLPDAHRHTRGERAQLPGPRLHRRPLPHAVLHVLHALGVHQLPVHTRAQHTRGHRRAGPVRHQRVLRVPAVLGHITRSVRRRPGESIPSPFSPSWVGIVWTTSNPSLPGFRFCGCFPQGNESTTTVVSGTWVGGQGWKCFSTSQNENRLVWIFEIKTKKRLHIHKKNYNIDKLNFTGSQRNFCLEGSVSGPRRKPALN